MLLEYTATTLGKTPFLLNKWGDVGYAFSSIPSTGTRKGELWRPLEAVLGVLEVTGDEIEGIKEVTKQGRSLSGIGPSYAEDVRDVVSLYRLIKPFMVNQEEGARFSLSERFHKPIETIDEYLSYGDYLDDHALSMLAKSGLDKRFFDNMQKIKCRLVTNLRHKDIFEQDITNKISETVLKMHQEYTETGKITRDRWLGSWGEGSEDRNGKRRFARRKAKHKKPPVFKYSPGATRPPEDLSVNMDETNEALKETLHRMREIPDLKDDNLGHVADYMKGEIFRLLHIHHDILVLAGKLKSSSQKKGI